MPAIAGCWCASSVGNTLANITLTIAMVEPGKHIATRASLTPVLGCSESNQMGGYSGGGSGGAHALVTIAGDRL